MSPLAKAALIVGSIVAVLLLGTVGLAVHTLRGRNRDVKRWRGMGGL